MRARFKKIKLQKLRRTFEFLIVAATFCTAEPDRTSLIVGFSISAMGELLRTWAAGYPLRLRSYFVQGPYRFVRHPRYLGTFLVLLGMAFAGQNPYVVGVYVVGIAIIYRFCLRAEERQLHSLVGPRFELYRSQVTAFIPQLIPYERSGQEPKFSLSFAIFKRDRREFESIGALALGFGLLYISMLIPSRTLAQGLLASVVLMWVCFRVFVISRRRHYSLS